MAFRGFMYTVYVLISLKDNRFYIGFISDIKRRIKEHKYGGNPSTKGRRPVVLIYQEIHFNKRDAIRREKYFKTHKGKHTLRQVVKNRLIEMGVDYVET